MGISLLIGAREGAKQLRDRCASKSNSWNSPSHGVGSPSPQNRTSTHSSQQRAAPTPQQKQHARQSTADTSFHPESIHFIQQLPSSAPISTTRRARGKNCLPELHPLRSTDHLLKETPRHHQLQLQLQLQFVTGSLQSLQIYGSPSH